MAQPRRKFGKAVALNGATAVDIKDPGTGQCFVTFVTLSIVTHAAGKLFQVQDNNSVVIAKHIDAAAAAGVPSVVMWDFGRNGVPLTAAKKCQVVSEASGIAGYAYVEGYYL